MDKERNITLLYAMAFLQGMVFYGPIATLYRQAAGVGLGEIALMEGVSLAFSVALELPWGILAEKLGYRRTMVLCSGLFFGTKLIFWRAAGFWGFFWERVLLGVVNAGLSGLDVGILYLSCPQEKVHRVFGIYNNMTLLGLLSATAVYSLWIGERYRLAGALTAVTYALAALLSLFLSEVRPPERGRGRETRGRFVAVMGETLGQKGILSLLAGAALLGACHQMVTVFYSQSQYRRLGMDDAGMGLAYALVTLLGLLGGLSARLKEKVGQRRLLILLPLASAVACALLALTESPLLSVLAVAALRVSFYLFQPLQETLQNREVHTEDRATALSVHAVLLDAVTISATLLLGRVSERSLSGAFLLGAGLCLGSLALLLRAGEKPA